MVVTGYKNGLNWKHPLSLVRMPFTFMRLKSKRLETPKKATNPEDDSEPLSSLAGAHLVKLISAFAQIKRLKATPRVLVFFLIKLKPLQNLLSHSVRTGGERVILI